ncbi:FAE1_CUT1_RppA domain-containing protein/ACP_syn_III_C domain-containing protein [Cephalotus follicularis]|uniref:3-ketoacyl-CoA synthase n=1 Tax=Cephalotus follicularis TaxID=3775 RepID=A0A1Q3DJG2_CEPFO|nr:FAE1_CUT1_RppA domain-containing protein/ACP_syn_III_C domain-containing protein [Cephalotus follicularis]
MYLWRRCKRIYLVDFICYQAPNSYRVPISTFIEHAERLGNFNSETVEFLTKVNERSGIGNNTYLPTGCHLFPSDQGLKAAVEEVEMVLFSTVQNLFTKHKINPKSIDILITNCSLVCPTPSLAAMIINKFGLRSNVMNFHLSGMGCSAGLLSISLARDLLKVHKNSSVLVLSMESICSNFYVGKVKSMLLANCLFRMGGAAILLSNRKRDKQNARYELQHIIRTHLGSKDSSYKCVYQEPDDEGYTGVALSRSIVQVAGEALKINVAALSALVLPYSELILYGLSVVWRKVWPPARKRGPYIPDFKKAFEHFCIHAGGKAVIDSIKGNLKLKDRDVEASKMTLYRFGNTSSSSTWYSLSYLEAKGKVKMGDRVWQLAFGSGFKCNSSVWKCISKLQPYSSNVWLNNIQQYPV